jgi:hypothetical protein
VERPDAEVQEQEPPGDADGGPVVEQERRDRGQAEPRDGAVQGVGGGRPEPADEARTPPLRERPLDAEDAYRADRGRDGDPEDDPLNENVGRGR